VSTTLKTANKAIAKANKAAKSEAPVAVAPVAATIPNLVTDMNAVIPRKFGFEETPIEDLTRMQCELQRAAEFLNVELKINLQHPFAIQMGEYNHSDRIYGKIVFGSKSNGVMTAPFTNASGDGVWSIILNPKHFNRPVTMIVETILHELVHAKNAEMGIKDTTGAGIQRHNANFKKTAEQYGLLTLGEDKTYGFYQTDLAPKTLNKVVSVLKLDATAFTLVANSIAKNAPAKKVQSQVKFECPACESKARAIPTVVLFCGCTATPTLMQHS
jgi:hypothetical protein